MSSRNQSAAAPVFAALGEPTRLRLLSRLSTEGPLSITALTDGAGVTRQAITRHLDVLQEVGLVKDEKQGRERVFSLDRKRLEVAQRYLLEIESQWDAAAARLKAFVEGES